MISCRKLFHIPWVAVIIFFVAHFIYFALFNRFHIVFQEQIQLFLFDWNYFTGFLTKPGGLTTYISTFFIQFYLNPFTGAFIVTLAGIAIYALTGFIFRKCNILGILWSFIPVLFLIALQSDPYFTIGYTIGLLLVLAFIALYISIHNDYLRYAAGFIGWFFLYLATGGFALLSTVMCITYELLFAESRYRLITSLGYALIAAFLPYLAWRSLYFIPIAESWLNPIISLSNVPTKNGLLLLLVYFPVLLIMQCLKGV